MHLKKGLSLVFHLMAERTSNFTVNDENATETTVLDYKKAATDDKVRWRPIAIS